MGALQCLPRINGVMMGHLQRLICTDSWVRGWGGVLAGVLSLRFVPTPASSVVYGEGRRRYS